jgi:FdhE protein
MTDAEKLKRIAELEGKEGIDRKALGLLSALIALRIDMRKRIDVKPASSELRQKRLAEGGPLVRRQELVVDLAEAVRHWRALERAFKGQGIAVDTLPEPEVYVRRCIEDKDHLQGGPGGDREEGLRHFMLLEVLKPFYEAYAEVYGKQVDDAEWVRPYCYVCGSSPDMAVLVGEGGKRYLYCRLCDTRWWYARLKCPYCGNEDVERLVSVSLEGEPECVIHACTACNRYLKVFDERVEDDLFLELEDLRTSILDETARAEGFAHH